MNAMKESEIRRLGIGPEELNRHEGWFTVYYFLTHDRYTEALALARRIGLDADLGSNALLTVAEVITDMQIAEVLHEAA